MPVLLASAADPAGAVALSLALMLLAAKLGGDLAVRLRQPPVLGELLAGVVLGNLTLFGYTGLEPLESDESLELLASLGVLLLLFEVGLESTVGQMLRVGARAALVALLGVIAPFALGWGVGATLLPGQGPYVHAFLGATLCATSVGITARVLKDSGYAQTNLARVILGAAVIDDVLGLVILAVVAGAIAAADAGTAVSAGAIAWILGKAGLFLVGGLLLGVWLSPRAFALASRLRSRGVLLAVGLSFCFLLSWAAAQVGLAPIVGAFAAGLILEDVHYKEFTSRGEHGLEELVHPISQFLVPIFFVLMGMRTELSTFLEPGVIGLAATLTTAAVLGKQLCALGVWDGIPRWPVGIGMIPRGEVGLIFANVGLGLQLAGKPILGRSSYSAIVVMVIVTTLVAPPLLKWSLRRVRPEEA